MQANLLLGNFLIICNELDSSPDLIVTITDGKHMWKKVINRTAMPANRADQNEASFLNSIYSALKYYSVRKDEISVAELQDGRLEIIIKV